MLLLGLKMQEVILGHFAPLATAQLVYQCGVRHLSAQLSKLHFLDGSHKVLRLTALQGTLHTVYICALPSVAKVLTIPRHLSQT